MEMPMPEVIAKATKFRNDRLKSVASDRGITDLTVPIDTLQLQLVGLPNYAQVDNCVPSGEGLTQDVTKFFCDNQVVNADPNRSVCEYVPPECQQTLLPGATVSFYPYQNCSIDTIQGADCAQRLRCGKQEGYKGPFEYIRPLSDDWDGPTEQCGCFLGENSYFPDDAELQQSVCDWQDLVMASYAADNMSVPYEFCRLDVCANKTKNNEQLCASIKKWGLDNVPTGNLFNSPYPDSQNSVALRYPNQDPESLAEEVIKECKDYFKEFKKKCGCNGLLKNDLECFETFVGANCDVMIGGVKEKKKINSVKRNYKNKCTK